VSCALGNETNWILVFEPAVLGGALGRIALCSFMGVYLSAGDKGARLRPPSPLLS
jgi:hypothetical protein